MRVIKKFNKFSEKLLDLIYPWHCYICGAHTCHKGVCHQCETYLPWIERLSQCSVCALPLVAGASQGLICGQCLKDPPFYDRLRAVFWYQSPIDNLITEYKYFNHWQHARTLIELTHDSFARYCVSTNCLIVPVPSHPTRIKQRGFNAVYELIKLFRKKHSIDYDDKLVTRIKNTDTQTGKSKLQRRQNVHHAFAVNKGIQTDHIMLVDEVVTTGATVNELSRCLKKAGVSKVSVWAIARTKGNRKLQGKPIACSNT